MVDCGWWMVERLPTKENEKSERLKSRTVHGKTESLGYPISRCTTSLR
jgi:hypothetical protein